MLWKLEWEHHSPILKCEIGFLHYLILLKNRQCDSVLTLIGLLDLSSNMEGSHKRFDLVETVVYLQLVPTSVVESKSFDDLVEQWLS